MKPKTGSVETLSLVPMIERDNYFFSFSKREPGTPVVIAMTTMLVKGMIKVLIMIMTANKGVVSRSWVPFHPPPPSLFFCM